MSLYGVYVIIAFYNTFLKIEDRRIELILSIIHRLSQLPFFKPLTFLKRKFLFFGL